VWTALRYTPTAATEIRCRLRLRSTTPGANNRLDIQAIVSWDREEGHALPATEIRPDEEAGEAAEQRQYDRGLTPYVFGEEERPAWALLLRQAHACTPRAS
jgi:F-box protein 9